MAEEHLDHALAEEFAGRGAEIHALKLANAHFRALMQQNHKLWLEIQNIQKGIAPAEDSVLDNLEKARLRILDEIAAMLDAR